MKVYLDDVRDPPDDTWTVARSYLEFRHVVETAEDDITEISFDHDLGLDGSNAIALTGMDAVKWLMDHIEYFAPELKNPLEKITCHSSNPAGAENILGYCQSAKKHGILNPEIILKRV